MENGPDGFPPNCPSPQDLRVVASWLTSQFPNDAWLNLAASRDYPALHELAGAHDAIQAVAQLAVDLEQAQADQEAEKAARL